MLSMKWLFHLMCDTLVMVKIRFVCHAEENIIPCWTKCYNYLQFSDVLVIGPNLFQEELPLFMQNKSHSDIVTSYLNTYESDLQWTHWTTFWHSKGDS